jgi:hypothetical protein
VQAEDDSAARCRAFVSLLVRVAGGAMFHGRVSQGLRVTAGAGRMEGAP